MLIAISALIVTSLVLLLRMGLRGTCQRLRNYVTGGLPKIVNELCLFLAAGVLAAGISALIQHGLIENPFSQFDSITAIQVLAIKNKRVFRVTLKPGQRTQRLGRRTD